MGDADAHPTGIAGEIVNAIGDRPAQFLDQEVVNPHLFRLALATPLASGVLEVADELLFLGVDRDHRLAFGQGGADLGVDVGELGIAIWMAVALAGLAVGLKAELLLPQQFAHDRVADAMPQGGELGGQPAQALAGPAQRRHRIAARLRLDQPVQVVEKLPVRHDQRFAAAARTADAARLQPRRRREVPQAAADGTRGDAGDPRHCRNAAVTGCRGFRGCEQPPPTFVEMRRQGFKTFANQTNIEHARRIGYDPKLGNPPKSQSNLVVS